MTEIYGFWIKNKDIYQMENFTDLADQLFPNRQPYELGLTRLIQSKTLATIVVEEESLKGALKAATYFLEHEDKLISGPTVPTEIECDYDQPAFVWDCFFKSFMTIRNIKISFFLSLLLLSTVGYYFMLYQYRISLWMFFESLFSW